jgi:hypothetical protein
MAARRQLTGSPLPWFCSLSDANAQTKCALETYVNREVCRGTMSSTPASTASSLVLRSPRTRRADDARTRAGQRTVDRRNDLCNRRA